MRLPTVDVVDAELFAGTTFAFDLRFWSDKEKTEPHDVESFQCSVYANGEELLDLDQYSTVDEDDLNVVHVSVPPEASMDLKTVEAKWQAVTTFTDGDVLPSFSGKLQIWGRKVDRDIEEP